MSKSFWPSTSLLQPECCIFFQELSPSGNMHGMPLSFNVIEMSNENEDLKSFDWFTPRYSIDHHHPGESIHSSYAVTLLPNHFPFQTEGLWRCLHWIERGWPRRNSNHSRPGHASILHAGCGRTRHQRGTYNAIHSNTTCLGKFKKKCRLSRWFSQNRKKTKVNFRVLVYVSHIICLALT